MVEKILKRGVTLNNPKLPVKEVVAAATSLDVNDEKTARAQLRAFIEKRPLVRR